MRCKSEPFPSLRLKTMSLSEDSVSCPTENSVTAHLDSASVSDAEKTVLKNTNVHSHVEEDTQNDSELLKGLLTDTFCQVCEAVLMFESQRVSHYEGKKHAQRVRVYLQTKKAERSKQSCESSSFQRVSADPEKFCELCNMVFSSPVVAKSHYEGKVHAKNTRKSSASSSLDTRTTASPVTTVQDTVEVNTQDNMVQEQKEITATAAQGVDLSDPDKYCKLCAASFNNPVMASEHYSGRKHQRNLARQEQQSKLGEQSEHGTHANSLTCPVCHVTLTSVDTYQAHMKANKHNIKEKKTLEDPCKKKVYDSFQDELADYIQVQRSRGLGPKTGQGSEPQEHRKAESEVDESGECRVQPQTVSIQSCLPAPVFRAQPWRPPIHPHHNPATLRGRFPVLNQWDQGYLSYPPPLIPGLTGRALRRGRSPESFSSSSSSFSDSSSSYSSSSEDSRDRRRRRKKRQEGTKKQREEEDDSDEDLQKRRRERRKRDGGNAKKLKRQRGSSDDDHGKRCKEKKHRERVSKKRRTEEDEREWDKASHVEVTKEDKEEQGEELKEEKTKHKKEKKKPKDREDNRTEEEKLWDETILGIF